MGICGDDTKMIAELKLFASVKFVWRFKQINLPEHPTVRGCARLYYSRFNNDIFKGYFTTNVK
jgi:hypothetical protein